MRDLRRWHPTPGPGDAQVRMIGRDGELASLREGLGMAAAGRGATMLVAGVAGIGKTRLVSEFGDRARAAGAAVLYGRCVEFTGPPIPYMALLEALRSAPGPEAGRAGGPPAGPHRRAVLAALAGPVDPAAQLGLFDAMRAALAEAAESAPLVLILDDLHWADAATLDFVALLARSVQDSRILVVVTYRCDEVRPSDPMARLAVELVRARTARALELPPLPADELRLVLELAAGRCLPAELSEVIFSRSGGNPFFAEQLLAAADRDEQDLPDLLRDVLLRWVERLEPASRHVTRVAAAFGPDTPYRVLAGLTTIEEPWLTEALRQAVEHGVLVPDRGTYRFRHALLAEAVYGTILPGEAERLHEGLALALTDDPSLSGDRSASGELARHWDAAGRPAETLVSSVRAARDAEAVGGVAEALRHVERALDLWPDVAGAAQLVAADRPALLAWAAELADLNGAGHRAAALVLEAVELTEVDDPVRAGSLRGRLGGYLLAAGDHEAALAACQRAVEQIPALPPSAGRARALASLGEALMRSRRYADSVVAAEQAKAVAVAVGDEPSATRALTVLSIDLCYLDRPAEAQAMSLAAQEQALRSGTPRDLAYGFAALCELLTVTGPPGQAARVAEEGLAALRRLGVERAFGAALAAYAAEAYIAVGDWDLADDLLADTRWPADTFAADQLRLARARLAIGRGHFADARRQLAAASAAQSPVRLSACLDAELALWERRPDAAAHAIEAALTGPDDATAAHSVQLCALGLRLASGRAGMAAVCRDRHALNTASRRGQRLVRMARRAAEATVTVAMPEAAAWRAVAEAEYRSITAHSGGDPGRVATAWRQAVSAWDDLGRPYQAAYCRWRLVEALQPTAAEPADVLRTAREAYRVACALGAAPLRAELELLAERTRLDLVGLSESARPDPIGSSLGLTARECQVLRLLTRGYTNRQVAAELTISAKTASVHVTNIMRKLGVSRRIDAAAVAHRFIGAPPAPDPVVRTGANRAS